MKKTWLVAVVLTNLLAGTAYADYRGEVTGEGTDDSRAEACHEASENAYARLPEDARITELGECECGMEPDGDWECQVDAEYVIED